MQELRDQINPGTDSIEEVTMRLQRGQISFHHCCTIHGSYENRTSRPRSAVVIHLQDGDNRYRPAVDARGRRLGHLNDLLCSTDSGGWPNYLDEYLFPTLWPPQQAAG
jgi:ectoine hydroxylase-related dioxygenase (phytanoyl-CoA dioxygenase family)